MKTYPPGIRQRILTPPDAAGRQFEMGVGRSGESWCAYALIRGEFLPYRPVLLGVETLRDIASALSDETRDNGLIATFPGSAGGAVAFRAASDSYYVVAVVDTPAGSGEATWVRRGVAHIAEALLERVAEGD